MDPSKSVGICISLKIILYNYTVIDYYFNLTTDITVNQKFALNPLNLSRIRVYRLSYFNKTAGVTNALKKGLEFKFIIHNVILF